MKLGMIISGAILLVVIGVLIFFLHTPAPDDPTQLTSPKNLEKVTLTPDLPSMFVLEAPNASANEAYQKAFEYFETNRAEFVDNHGGLRADADPALADELTTLMITASKAGTVTTPFLDDAISFEPGGRPAFGDDMESVPDVVFDHAKKIYDKGDTAKGIAAVEAVWALGQRAFEKSQRLYPRLTGMQLMISAGQMLAEWTDKLPPDTDAKLIAWRDALFKVRDAWEPKILLIHNVHPHQGDLINMARNEQDIGLRAEAVLMIGVSKYKPDQKGNAVAFQEIMDAGKTDPDPMIQKAAAAADAFTREQLGKMR